MKWYHLSLILFPCFAMTVKAQVKYGVSASLGQSNFKEIKLNKQALNPNIYNPVLHWSVGGFSSIQLFHSEFSVRPEIKISNSGTKITRAEAGGFYPIEYRFNSLSFPMSIQYNYTKWLTFHAGLGYSYAFKNKSLGSDIELTHHNWFWNGGFDITLKNRFQIGAYYDQNFKSTLTQYNAFGFQPFDYGIKLGYIFN